MEPLSEYSLQVLDNIFVFVVTLVPSPFEITVISAGQNGDDKNKIEAHWNGS